MIDSVAALVPRNELSGDIGKRHLGLQARLMAQGLRKLCQTISRSHSVVIFVNQLRDAIGPMFEGGEIAPGGRALKFFASVRIDLRVTQQILQGEKHVGNRIRAKIVKNKVAPPFQNADLELYFGAGFVSGKPAPVTRTKQQAAG